MESVELQEIRKLEKKFDEHIKEDREYMSDVHDKLGKVWESVGQRVTWTWFWTIMMMCASVTTGVAYLLYDEISAMRVDNQTYFDKQNEKSIILQSDISQIKGKLEPYKIEFKD